MEKTSLVLKKILYLVIVLIIISLGVGSMIIPILPFGWILLGLAAFLIKPYFDNNKKSKKDPKWLKWIKKKDKKGWLEKGKKIVYWFYNWSHEKKLHDN